MQAHILPARLGARHVKGQGGIADDRTRRDGAGHIKGDQATPDQVLIGRAGEEIVAGTIAQVAVGILVERVVADRADDGLLRQRKRRCRMEA